MIKTERNQNKKIDSITKNSLITKKGSQTFQQNIFKTENLKLNLFSENNFKIINTPEKKLIPVVSLKKTSEKPRLFNHKQAAILAAAVITTFLGSIATSQGLAAYKEKAVSKNIALNNTSGTKLTDRLPDNILAVVTTPITPNLDEKVLDNPNQIFLPKENEVLPDPLKKRKEFLQQYLKSKNSLLADHVDAISEQSQWKLIIAIARAESSFCKRKALNNCWGIGGAWNLKNYASYDDAIADVNRILEQHYIQAGLDSPAKIVNKWVGHPNEDWEAAVEEELANLKDVE